MQSLNLNKVTHISLKSCDCRLDLARTHTHTAHTRHRRILLIQTRHRNFAMCNLLPFCPANECWNDAPAPHISYTRNRFRANFTTHSFRCVEHAHKCRCRMQCSVRPLRAADCTRTHVHKPLIIAHWLVSAMPIIYYENEQTNDD